MLSEKLQQSQLGSVIKEAMQLACQHKNFLISYLKLQKKQVSKNNFKGG